MITVDTVVIGAGHAGLAVSNLLTRSGRDHVVIDRGRIGERWRTERWDSMHLLSPNWMMRLPGWEYGGTDPDGFVTSRWFAHHLQQYAASFGAPIIDNTTVLELALTGSGDYRLVTDRGTWRPRHVIIATGPGSPRIPPELSVAAGDRMPAVVVATSYRNPRQLRAGGVLVVGASASGVQIADELNRAGREVFLAVGRHTRVPRSYRGKDIFWWLERTGRLSRTIHDVRDSAAARHEPSMQLVGQPRDLDLVTLQADGVRLLGHFGGLDGTRAHFHADLAESVAAADARMNRLLDSFDDCVDGSRASRPPVVVPPASATDVDLHRAGIGTILVATGYRPDYPWLRLPIIGPDGQIEQERGITAAPGVYVAGQRFQYRRDSGFIDGARHDAAAVVRHLLNRSGEESAA
jgi:putative flavoprotein involved in K+ transport